MTSSAQKRANEKYRKANLEKFAQYAKQYRDQANPDRALRAEIKRQLMSCSRQTLEEIKNILDKV